MSAPAIVLHLAKALPGWEILTGVTVQPDFGGGRPMVRISACDRRNLREVLTVHGQWFTDVRSSARTLVAELLLGGHGLSSEERATIAGLIPEYGPACPRGGL